MHGDRNFLIGFDADFQSLDKAISDLNGKLNAVNLPSVMQKFTAAIENNEAAVARYSTKIDTLSQRYARLNDMQKMYIQAVSVTSPGMRQLISNFDAATVAADRLANAERNALAARNRASQQSTYQGLFGRGGTQDTITQRSQRPSANEWDKMITNSYGAAPKPSTAKQSADVFAQSWGSSLKSTGDGVGRLSGIMDTFWGKAIGRFAMHMVQWTAWILLIDTAIQSVQMLEKTFSQAVERSAEFQIQGVQFQAAQESAKRQGILRGSDVSSPQLLTESIKLATQYGDKVNDVSQDLQLWYKRTGDLNAAMFMTNEGLKFQLATGTDLEDFYRTITALSSQMGNIPLSGKDKMGFDLTQTPRLMNMIVSASQAMGAGFHQVNKEGKELGSGTANAAFILLHALEQDASALGTLGLNGEKIITVNQALITSFGNTGSAAGEAGERVARLAGGIASLNKPSSVNALVKDGFNTSQIKGLQGVFDTTVKGGDVFEKFGKFLATLPRPLKEVLELQISGTRQWETTTNVLRAYEQNVQRVQKAMQDENAENRLASDMSETFAINVKKLQGAWDGFLITFGLGVLPELTTFVKYVTSDVIPAIGMMVDNLGTAMRTMGSLYKMSSVMGAPGGFLLPKNWQATEQGRQDFLKVNAEYEKAQAQANTGPVNIRGENATQAQKAGRLLVPPQFPSELSRRASLSPVSFEANTPHARSLVTAQNISWAGQAGIDEAVIHNKKMEAALRSIGGQKPEQGGRGVADPTAGKQKGAASEARLEADAIANLKDKYTALIDARKNNLTTIDDEIRLGERGVARYGSNSEYMDHTIVGLKKKRNELNAEQSILQNERGAFLKMQTGAEHQVRASKPGSTARTGADANLRRIHAEIYAINAEWFRNKAAIDDATDSIDKYMEKIVTDKYTKLNRQNDLDLTNANKAFTQAPSLGAKRQALIPLNAEFATELKTANDEIAYYNQHEKSQGILTENQENARTSAIAKRTQLLEQQAEVTKILKNETDSLNDTLNKGLAASGQALADTLLKGAGFKAPDQAYYQEVFKIQRDLVDQTTTWHETLKKIGTSMDQESVYERNLANSEMQRNVLLDETNLKFAEQKRLADTIKASDIYKATEIGVGTLGTGLSSGVMSAIDGTNASNKRVTAINQVTQALEQQKTAENDIYSLVKNHTAEQDAMHAIYMRNMDAEIAKSQQQAAAEKARQSNPSLLKKTFDDFTKSMMDSFITKIKTRVMGDLFPGAKDDPNKGLKDAMALYAKTTKEDLTKTLGSSDQGFFTSVNNFTDAVVNNSQGFNASALIFQRAVADLYTIVSRPPTVPGGSSGNSSTNVDVNNATNTLNQIFAPNNSAGSNTGVRAAFEAATAAGGGALLAMSGGSSVGIGAPSSGAIGTSSTSAGMFSGLASLPMSTQSMIGFSQNSDMNPFGWNGQTMSPYNGSVNNPGMISNLGSNLQNLLGIKQGGIGAGPGSLGKDLNIAGAAYGLYNAVTGTNPNGTVGGLGHAFQGATAGAQLGSLFGPVGTVIGAGVGFVAGLFGIGQHTPADQMPDESDTARFTQYVGELQGSAATAYGPAFNPASDPVIQQLHSPILDYIQSWVAKNLSSGNPDKKKLAQQLDALYGHTPGQGLGFGHDIGDEWVKGGSLRGKYTDIYSQAMTDLQNVLQLENANPVPQQLVGINQYGSGTGFFPYSWNTPGYNAPASPPGTGYPVAPDTSSGGTGTGTGGSTTGGSGGGGGGKQINLGGGLNLAPSSYAYSPSVVSIAPAPIVVNQNISMPIDGRMLSRVTQSYTARANAQGYSNVS